jgi:hypothetical protein
MRGDVMALSARSVLGWSALLLALALGAGAGLLLDSRREGTVLLAAQPPRPLDWYADMPPLRHRLELALNTAGADDWRGRYGHGAGGYVWYELLLVPEQGFLFHEHTDAGLSGKALGRATWQDGQIRLHTEFSAQLDAAAEPYRPATAYLPVRWGERRYLIETTRLAEFVRAVNFGVEPRYGYGDSYFWLRRGDHEKVAGGRPELPAEVLALLRETSITVKVTAVEFIENSYDARRRERQARYRLRLSGGAAQGLLAGMPLQRLNDDFFEGADVATVETVQPQTSTALLQTIVPDSHFWVPPPPPPPGATARADAGLAHMDHPNRTELHAPMVGQRYRSGGADVAADCAGTPRVLGSLCRPHIDRGLD